MTWFKGIFLTNIHTEILSLYIIRIVYMYGNQYNIIRNSKKLQYNCNFFEEISVKIEEKKHGLILERKFISEKAHTLKTY